MRNRAHSIRGKAMRIPMTAVAVGFAVALASIVPPAQAQQPQGRAVPHRHAPLRIEITPSLRLFRQCVDWHVVEHRATGDTVVPRMRCWWALR
jgi:hypothetical protein